MGYEYKIVIDNQNPDYLIYNVFDDKDIKSKCNGCIRIAFYTENIMPDLNSADYAIAHYHINYLDRYFKYSIFLYSNIKNIKRIRKYVLKNKIRNKFCAGVISNCNGNFRMKFIHKLNKYKKIDMGGKCENNIGRRVKNKKKFLRNYKFSIAMENSGGDGYITEKIADSFLAGTIPIYYGNFLVDEYINPKTYILIRSEKDIDEKIELIKKIDNDDKLYKSIIMENPIIDDKFINKIFGKEFKDFIINIFSQDKEKAARREKSFYDYQCSGIT